MPATATGGRPWDHQPGETAMAYEAFLVYLYIDAVQTKADTLARLGDQREAFRVRTAGLERLVVALADLHANDIT